MQVILTCDDSRQCQPTDWRRKVSLTLRIEALVILLDTFFVFDNHFITQLLDGTMHSRHYSVLSSRYLIICAAKVAFKASDVV